VKTHGGFWRASAGATAVELAMVAPIFLALLFGVIQGGIMLWTQFALEHASEQAARCASINRTLCGTTTQVQAFAASQSFGRGIPSSAFMPSVQTCGSQVNGTYPVSFWSASVTLSAQSCFPK
jgi:Flp pilus assembly protein TadG